MSKFYSYEPLKKLPTVTSLDPHIYDPSSKENSTKSDSNASVNSSSSVSASATSAQSEFTSMSRSSSSGDTASKYLDYDDVFSTKKLLGKICKSMVDSTCHHGRKLQHLESKHEKLQNDVATNFSVLNDFTVDLDLKIADRFNETLEKLDPQMNALQEIAFFSKELTAWEEYLDHTAPQIRQELDTIKRAKQNLIKQMELEDRVKELEGRSFHHRAVFVALEYDNDRMIRKAVVASDIKRKHYGLAEITCAIPVALVDLTDFQRELMNMKRFYTSCAGIPKINFLKLDALIDDVKNSLSTHLLAALPTALSPSQSTAASFVSGKLSRLSTSNSTFVPSSNALELAVSRSCSDLSDLTTSNSTIAI